MAADCAPENMPFVAWRSSRFCAWAWHGVVALGLALAELGAAPAVVPELPAATVANLQAESFQDRERAQRELMQWARGQPEAPVREALFRHSRDASDPEIRERCLAVLRELVTEEYLREGEGYIGIRMFDDWAQVPGDPKVRGCVRVMQVVADSAAAQAGLIVNDLIVAMNGEIWRDGSPTEIVREKIRRMKPKTVIKLSIMREGRLKEVPVTLGRRPKAADTPFFDMGPVDMDAAEQAAKDAYFKRWLERRKEARP